jgi:ABC-type phosphate transport system auxiliary subunit
MGAKKKKGGKKKKGKNAEVEPDDDYMKMDGETLEQTRGRLKDKLAEAKIKRNMLQMEKDMVQDFYHNTRAEIKELEARVKNLDTDMQSMEEKHRTVIKVFMQKVKHLEYEHSNNQDKVRNDAVKVQKEERHTHIEN